MPYKKTLTCADCGKPMWAGKGSLPQGRARCRACRRPGSVRTTTCPDCGGAKAGHAVRCRPCDSKARTIRSEDDDRLRRKHRESAAPGITWTARRNLLAKWKRQSKPCVYCGGLADTIDHVVPLVRGGTNYEGNLAPCCRSCNGSKAGYLIAEWRMGKRLPRMTKAPEWKRSRKRKPIEAIKGVQLAFNVCPACGLAYVGKGTYCSNRCQKRSAYRLKVGIPVDGQTYGMRRGKTTSRAA